MFSRFNIFNKKSLSSSTLSTDTLEYGKFNLENVSGNFLVDSVYDGDTITLVVPIKMEIYDMDSPNTLKSTNPNNIANIKLNKIKVRLFGIDTPELKPSKNLINREAHIAKAKEARDFLSNMILNKIIKINFLQNDKYGRPLVKLYANNVEGKEICLNELMISKGFAKEYDGGTKDSNFTDLVDTAA